MRQHGVDSRTPMPETVFQFAEVLRRLLYAGDPQGFEAVWVAEGLEDLGWDALGRAWRADAGRWERALDEADGLLLRLLDRLPVLAASAEPAARHLPTPPRPPSRFPGRGGGGGAFLPGGGRRGPPGRAVRCRARRSAPAVFLKSAH